MAAVRRAFRAQRAFLSAAGHDERDRRGSQGDLQGEKGGDGEGFGRGVRRALREALPESDLRIRSRYRRCPNLPALPRLSPR